MNKIKLSIRNMYQKYNNDFIIKGVSLDVFQGEILVILGPSGCGKTSLLKSIAGLIPTHSGELLLDGLSMEDQPPQKRKTIMIFQNYALFPHMTVKENLEYGLKVKNRNIVDRESKISNILCLLKLEGLEGRPVTELSGGQQQRVAIGRAMIIDPSVLLFDEPLSNLDENLRKQMRNEIQSIIRLANITSIYVTHDQNEALAMADRIVVMKDGRIEQIATPSELHHKPYNEYVANFLGYKNIFKGECKEGNLFLFGKIFPINKSLNQRDVSVLIRPEDISISINVNTDFSISGKVSHMEIQNSVIRYNVKTQFGGFDVSKLNRRDSAQFLIGDQVYLGLNTSSFHLLSSSV